MLNITFSVIVTSSRTFIWSSRLHSSGRLMLRAEDEVWAAGAATDPETLRYSCEYCNHGGGEHGHGELSDTQNCLKYFTSSGDKVSEWRT